MKNLHETKKRVYDLDEKRVNGGERGEALNGLVGLQEAAPEMVEVIRAQDELLLECLGELALLDGGQDLIERLKSHIRRK